MRSWNCLSFVCFYCFQLFNPHVNRFKQQSWMLLFLYHTFPISPFHIHRLCFLGVTPTTDISHIEWGGEKVAEGLLRLSLFIMIGFYCGLFLIDFYEVETMVGGWQFSVWDTLSCFFLKKLTLFIPMLCLLWPQGLYAFGESEWLAVDPCCSDTMAVQPLLYSSVLASSGDVGILEYHWLKQY